MTEQQKIKQNAEDFVRRVLSQDFHQATPASVVREVAAKVAKAIPPRPVGKKG